MALFDPPAPRPRLPSLREAFELFGEAFEHRSALAQLELAEARDHAVRSAILGLVTGLLGLFAGFAFTLLIAGLVWDSPHRVLWLAGLCLAYILGCVGTGYALRRHIRDWRPLEETQSQLQQDRQCLSQLIKSALS